MLTWIKSNPLYAGIVAVLGLALIAGAFAYMTAKDKRREQQLQEQGVTKERLDAQNEVLNRVEQAIEVERNPDPAFSNRVRCKYDRSANC